MDVASPTGITLAAVLGLVIGSFLNVVVTRVPRRESLLAPSHCPRCHAPIRPWHNVPVLGWLTLRGRCHDCRAPISLRYPVVEAGTGIAFALIAAWSRELAPAGPGRLLLATTLATFAALSIGLALMDLDTRRLPDAVVVPAYPAVLGLLTATSAATGDWTALGRGGAGLLTLAALYRLGHAARPDALGPGDVKLAGLIGLVTAYVGWDALAVGAVAAILLAGGHGTILLAAGRAGRRTTLAFGPWMLAGGWIGLLMGTQITSGYLHVSGLA